VSLAGAIARTFPAGERAAVEALLMSYEENEAPRVRLAILALANGDLVRLGEMVRAAKLDYRDVLYWAEYPGDSRSMTRDEAAARYEALGVPLPAGLRKNER
jgi:hypothetical protein